MASKLTATGYQRLTQSEYKAEIFAKWRSKSALGSSFVDSPDAPQTAIAESIAELLADIDEAIASAYSVASRTSAVGQQLDNIGNLIGVPRRQATKSEVAATVNLNAGVTLPAGSQAADANDAEAVYETIAAVTNSTGSPANVAVTMRAVTAGSATFVASGDLTSIVTPVTGWNSVTNAADADVGTDRETDAAYRTRQLLQLSVAGTGTLDAIRSAVAAVASVTQAEVQDNVDLITSSVGLPSKSVEAIVSGGSDNAIAQAIWANKPAGIKAFGGASGTATDVYGNSITVAFSRPTEVPIYIDYTLTTDATYPGDAAFKAAVATAASALFGLGDDVIYTRFVDLAFGVAGVVDVTLLEIGISASPSGTSNIPIASRQIATFDTTRITII